MAIMTMIFNRLAVAAALFVLFAGTSQDVSAKEVCNVKITGCLNSIGGDTIKVPGNTKGISKDVYDCRPEILVYGSAKDTASIMFVIDESSSMFSNDPSSKRYEVARELVKKLKSEAPQTRVGVSVFTDRLEWNYLDNPIFRRISDPFQWDDSYLPLHALDSTFSNGRTYADTIISLLGTRNINGKQILATKSLLDVGRTVTQSTTDISLGFEAALDAFKFTPTRKERQFVVFFSDGLPTTVSPGREANTNDFVTAAGYPTTFTYYIVPDTATTVPNKIKTMTQNINDQNTGAGFIQSTHEAINAADLDKAVDNILSLVTTAGVPAIVTPREATINGSYTTTSNDGQSWQFSSTPLLADGMNPMNVVFEYAYENASGGTTDTTLEFSFIIHKDPQTTDWSDLPAGVLQKDCFIQAGIESIAYRDDNGDGYIDIISILTEDAVRASELSVMNQNQGIITLPSFRNLTIDTIAVKTDGSVGFNIEVTQDRSKASIFTGVTGNDILTLDTSSSITTLPADDFSISDSMAPVVVRAVYRQGVQDSSGATSDLLDVYFAERMETVTQQEPFQFVTPGGDKYTLQLESISVDSNKQTFKVLGVNSQSVVAAQLGDSLWIYPDRVADPQDVMQKIPKNNPVRLEFELPEFKFKVSAIGLTKNIINENQNFFNSLPANVAGKIKNLGNDAPKGSLVQIDPQSSSVDRLIVDKMDIDIYDAVGNHLADKEGVEFGASKASNRIYYYWDGLTFTDRYAGAGTYRGFVKIVFEDDNGSEKTEDQPVYVPIAGKK
ncbi:MAG: hypothetical protein GF398_08480 [Chitinivibrionales bacterium]|nr:hypothetical protein [Chitinivibrionales bacterium]